MPRGDLQLHTESLLLPEDVADHLGITLGSLNNMRYKGDGPSFVKLGHRTIRYRREDVDEWVELHVVRH